jgi:hypothetical protein
MCKELMVVTGEVLYFVLNSHSVIARISIELNLSSYDSIEGNHVSEVKWLDEKERVPIARHVDVSGRDSWSSDPLSRSLSPDDHWT